MRNREGNKPKGVQSVVGTHLNVRELVELNVHRIRQRKDLTQERFAELSGFSQQYISGLERGRRNPTVVTLYELATVLGVSHMELLRPCDRVARNSLFARQPATTGYDAFLLLSGTAHWP